MKRMPIVLAAACMVVSAPLRADPTDTPELARRYAEVLRLIADRRFADAEPKAKSLLEFGEKKFVNDPAVRVMCYCAVASVYDLQGRYTEEERYLQGGLFLSDYLDAAEDLPAVKSLNMLALAFHGQKRFREAERLFKRSLLVTEKARGPDHADVGECLLWLGIVSY